MFCNTNGLKLSMRNESNAATAISLAWSSRMSENNKHTVFLVDIDVTMMETTMHIQET